MRADVAPVVATPSYRPVMESTATGLLRSYRRLVVVLDGFYMPGLWSVLIGRSIVRQRPISFPFWASV